MCFDLGPLGHKAIHHAQKYEHTHTMYGVWKFLIMFHGEDILAFSLNNLLVFHLVAYSAHISAIATIEPPGCHGESLY